MKLFFIKFICFITGADFRQFFPEKFDLSKVYVWKEYGSNSGFVDWYNSYEKGRNKFVNGICISFYGDTFVVKGIYGLSTSGIHSIAINKRCWSK